MKTFNTVCAQGDIYIRKISALPSGALMVSSPVGVVVVTHSGSGHHHVMSAEGCTMYRLPDSIMDCFLVVDRPTELRHLRTYDTHAPILFAPGTYHVRRQREYTPEGFRRVED